MAPIQPTAPQIPPQDMERILRDSPNIVCQECGNATFQEVIIFKHLSELVSPEGKAGAVPIPTFACNACGNVNEVFLPAFLRKTQVEKATVTDANTETKMVPSTTKIEIVR
jgi:uncharacterized Zn finger protein